MNHVVTVLKRSQTLLEKGWCREAMARDKHGESCSVMSKEATQFCLIGATMRAQREITADLPHDAQEKVRGRIYKHIKKSIPDYGSIGLSRFNDLKGQTQAKIVDVMAKAVKRAEAKEG